VTNHLVARLAAKSQHKNHQHVAIVTRGGAVVSVGYNGGPNGCVHAEAMALGKLWPSERVGTKLHSIRLMKSGRMGLAKPCPECQKLIEESGVKAVFYSDNCGNMVHIKVARKQGSC